VLVTGCAMLRPDPALLARLEPDLAQLLLVGFNGTETEANAELDRLLCEVRVGGIILFGRNVVGVDQIRRLTGSITDRARACGRPDVLIAVDAEGGRVMRLDPQAGFTPSLSHSELGDSNDFAATELEALRIGGLLREAGITWNLGPVVDVGYNPANPVIVGLGRSFGANPVLVTEHARAWVRGMRAAGVLTALKHFPGHGSSFGDSHLGFVDVTATANPDIELIPYRALIAEGLVDAVMTAHVFNRHLDPVYPATLSRPTISGLLRRDLGFGGVVVTDDLGMGAIQQHYGLAEASLLALEAGADMLLIAEDRLAGGESAAVIAQAALRRGLREGRLAPERVAQALGRLDALRERQRARNSSTSDRRGSESCAPRRVQASAAVALANRTAGPRAHPSASATARPALNASPAAVVSTALTPNAGTCVTPSAAHTSAPSLPSVTMTVRTPRARSTAAADAAETRSRTPTPVSRSASTAFGVR
jgi:beta-N-acetylhexosaminidase